MNKANEVFIDKGIILHGTSPRITARLIDAGTGDLPLAADITSITRRVFDVTSDPNSTTEIGSAVTLTIADVWEDTPVTDDDEWTAGTGGYNFHDVIDTTIVAGGAAKKKYRISYKITPDAGKVFYLRIYLEVDPAQGV